MRMLMTALAMTFAVPVGAMVAPASAEARSWDDGRGHYGHDYRDARREHWREERRREHIRELRRERRAEWRHHVRHEHRYADRHYRGW